MKTLSVTKESLKHQIKTIAEKARKASYQLASLTTEQKNQLLHNLRRELLKNTTAILEANRRDCRKARGKVEAAFLDRLTLTPERIKQAAEGLELIAGLKDPIGEVVAGYRTRHPLEIRKVRVPLGVVGFIFESRPNVAIDATGLCLKSGNALILKGGKEAEKSNATIVHVIRQTLKRSEVSEDAVCLLPGGREGAKILMKLRGLVDLLIPRGGQKLIDTVVRNAQVPVIETGVGNCHVYIDESADLQMALEIVLNAKVQRPSVCNAAETLLVHRKIASDFLPRCVAALQKEGVEIRACPITRQIVPGLKAATAKDYATEFLSLVLAVRVVDSLDQAIEHIRKYHSQHTEAIVTQSLDAAKKFVESIDSACLMVNCSTRFSDGFELGLGAEVGISTQKLHARGPMGLEALTSTKTIVYGRGQVRS